MVFWVVTCNLNKYLPQKIHSPSSCKEKWMNKKPLTSPARGRYKLSFFINYPYNLKQTPQWNILRPSVVLFIISDFWKNFVKSICLKNQIDELPTGARWVQIASLLRSCVNDLEELWDRLLKNNLYYFKFDLQIEKEWNT